MSQNAFTRAQLRDPENPFNSVMFKPWVMVAIDGLQVRLHETYCPDCNETLLFRKYYASKAALLWEHSNTDEGVKRRDDALSLSTFDLYLQTVQSPAWVSSGPLELINIRSNLPAFVKEFFSNSKSIFTSPYAMHKGKTLGDGSTVLGNFCPYCKTELHPPRGSALTTLMVTTDGQEPALYPAVFVCQLG